MMLRRLLTLPLLALAPALGHAADVDLLADAPEVELAASHGGFYLRGDVFADVSANLDGTRVLAQGAALAAAPAGGVLDDSAAIGLGVGYRFTDMLRGDVSLRYGQADLGSRAFAVPGCGSLCLAGEAADLHSLDLLASAYLDLGTFAGFTPYLGAGLGAVHLDYDDVRQTRCGLNGCGTLAGSGEGDWRFAYALQAGLAYDLTRTLKLDLGYRFLDAEKGEAWRVTMPGGSAVAVSDDGLTRHSVSIGLRVAFD